MDGGLTYCMKLVARGSLFYPDGDRIIQEFSQFPNPGTRLVASPAISSIENASLIFFGLLRSHKVHIAYIRILNSVQYTITIAKNSKKIDIERDIFYHNINLHVTKYFQEEYFFSERAIARSLKFGTYIHHRPVTRAE
uniref:Uncharacterized protein n=1 Tax=Megaselia scalaris TaxID=36166 RepID=T1GDQ1_MEGSC